MIIQNLAYPIPIIVWKERSPTSRLNCKTTMGCPKHGEWCLYIDILLQGIEDGMRLRNPDATVPPKIKQVIEDELRLARKNWERKMGR